MTKFKVDNTYSTPSVCDSNCIFKFKVIRRTEKSVWIIGSQTPKVVRKSISVWDNKEQFFPFGKYSMAPIISA